MKREAAGPLTLGEALRQATARLSSLDAPRITAEALLAHCLGLTRAQLLARLAESLPASAQADWESRVARAAEGEPLAYLTGQREFCGLDFAVDARVLVPRPETELLIDLARAGRPPRRWVDVGTGSGILAVTLAAAYPATHGVAIDLSAGALAVARANATRHRVAGRLRFVQGDLLSALAAGTLPFDLLVANLPYIPSAGLDRLPGLKHEPHLALDGGPDGLALIGRLLTQAPRVMAPGGRLLLEIEDTSGAAAVALARAAFPAAQVQLHRDWAGLDRGLEIRL